MRKLGYIIAVMSTLSWAKQYSTAESDATKIDTATGTVFEGPVISCHSLKKSGFTIEQNCQSEPVSSVGGVGKYYSTQGTNIKGKHYTTQRSLDLAVDHPLQQAIDDGVIRPARPDEVPSPEILKRSTNQDWREIAPYILVSPSEFGLGLGAKYSDALILIDTQKLDR